MGDRTVGLQGIGQCLSGAGSELQAAKTPWAPPGLGTLVSDLVVFEVDVGERTVGLQGICECLSEERRGRNCKLQRPRGHRLALAPSCPILLPSRLMSVTVQLDFKASASASQGSNGAGSKLPHLCHRESSCLPQSRTPVSMGISDFDLQLCDCVVQPKSLKKQLCLRQAPSRHGGPTLQNSSASASPT